MKSDRAVFLGVDVGTTSVKAGLVDASGQGLLQASREYPSYPMGQSRVEQSAWDWWDAATAAVRRLGEKAPALLASVRGISVSSQAPTLLAIGGDGQPLGRGMIWMDQRAEDVCREVLTLHAAYINGFSGNRLDPYYVLPKLLWHKRHEPEQYAQTWKYLQINGWLVYQLTGRCSIDVSSAALTQTLNVHTLRTEEGAFSLLGLDAGKWPEVFGCDEVVGTVTGQAAALWGVPEGTPVAAGCIDGASTPLGLGVTEPGALFEMSGQSSGIGEILREPAFHPNLCLLKHALPGLWIRKGSMSCSGGALKWFRDCVDGRSGQDFSVYSQLAEQSPPGARGVVFLPYLCGERAPLWDRTLQGMFFGLSTSTGREDLVRAIMEGTAFALRTILDEFQEPGIHEKVILGTGGGYHSRVWSQIKSDVLNCTIRVRQPDFDAALRGNAVLAMRALGMPAFERTETDREDTAVYVPDREKRGFYEERYQYYCKVFQANRRLFGENEV
ncbi:xylulokinase [Dysosmobacter sp. Sow4_B12]|uniref:xylulokinase n=1 Tax=Dysosmobacter sp. Sow4_B12 TaxID=3438777 RepID=UPI003F8EF81A